MTEASINFVVPSTQDDAEAFTFATIVATNEPLHIAPHSLTLQDLRERIGTIDLDTEGFAVERVPGAVLEGEKWAEKYALETCEWLRKYLGATRVTYYNYQIRRRLPKDEAPEEFDPDRLQPATVAHVDSSQGRSRVRTRETMGMSEEEAKGKRFAVVNVWRPLRGPVIDSPLAVCDARTMAEEDITLTTDIYGPGSFITYADRQKWCYLKDQMPDEVLLVRCFDSLKGPNEGGMTPHSAFIDEARMKSEQFELRQSIELRCVVLY